MRVLAPMTVRDAVAYTLILTEHVVTLRAPRNGRSHDLDIDAAVARAFATADAFVEQSTSDWAQDERRLRARAAAKART